MHISYILCMFGCAGIELVDIQDCLGAVYELVTLLQWPILSEIYLFINSISLETDKYVALPSWTVVKLQFLLFISAFAMIFANCPDNSFQESLLKNGYCNIIYLFL